MFTVQFFNDGVDIIKGDKILSLAYEDLETETGKTFWETKILPKVKTVEKYLK
jgi:hypothetical protein